ncbi:hypothetical protein PoB_000793300 [Plakobranchus ocellatus]|uniref:Reelin domain-containing protein n=1 Tax=Plakobranchus ocellatus TaxID=259542 RepID=A0AAV3YH19_9GAST|nr:hypothetical protein PoB_000793300 [Plakobranchus ocellatus]
MTHTGKEDKFKVEFDWTAPATVPEGQQFKLRCACVMNFFRCWTDLRVDLIIGRPGSSFPGTSTVLGNGLNNNNNINRNDNSNNNINRNDNNNRGAGVSDVSVGFGTGLENFPISSNSPGPLNNVGINNIPTSSVNNVRGTPAPNFPNGPVNSFPVLPANNVPNLFSDNSIGLPLDPSFALIPILSDGNSNSNFVLIPNGFQNRVDLDTNSLLNGLNRINGASGLQRPNQNVRGAQSSIPPTQTQNGFVPFIVNPSLNPTDNRNLQNPSSTNRNIHDANRIDNSRGSGRGRVSSFGRESRRILPENSRGRRPSDSNSLDQSLVRGQELFTLPADPTLEPQGFDFPTGFFMTPGALRRFRMRNSL